MSVYLINRYIWNDLQLDNLKVNCLLLKLYRKLRNMFLSPRPESNPQSSDLRWDALTIELPGLRWHREDYDVHWFVRANHLYMTSSKTLRGKYVCLEYLTHIQQDGPWNIFNILWWALKLCWAPQDGSQSVLKKCHHFPHPAHPSSPQCPLVRTPHSTT